MPFARPLRVKGTSSAHQGGRLTRGLPPWWTLPVILAIRRGDADERAFWRRCLEDVEQSDADLEHAIALMTRHNALDDSMALARRYGAWAREALAVFPDSELRCELIGVLEFCTERAY